MVSITGALFNALINDAGISDTNAEYILDQAIDLLNLYGNVDLPNMSGSAGNKTLSVESKQRGAIYLVARAVYYAFFKGIETSTAGGLTVATPDLLADPTVVQTVKEAARRLVEVDVDYG